MLCDRLHPRRVALGVAVAQRLHKVCVLRVAIGAGDAVRVIAVEIETLWRMHQHLEAVIALSRKEREKKRERRYIISSCYQRCWEIKLNLRLR